ncbi:MAG: hypothetical protein WBD27_00960 [Pyrinomonadaceae bacterium]
MPIIFNRDDADYAIYEDELEKWENSGRFDQQAMAVNMRYDPRITKARELRFRRYFEPHRKLTKALEDHWIKEIRSQRKPEFCSPICNNFVAFCSKPDDTCCAGFDKGMELATVINLHGFLEPIKNTSHGIDINVPEWKDFEDIDTHASDYRSNLNVWLNAYLENNYLKKGEDPKEIEPLIEALFKIINFRLSKGLSYQPVWVTSWQDFQQYTNRIRPDGTLNIDRWNQIVGVPRHSSIWQIIVKYPLSAVSCLHRPSILDGGYIYGQHFPSPPRIRKAVGGHTMDLGNSDDKLMSEYIHTQIPLKLEYWIGTGYLIGRTLASGYYDLLPSNRLTHHQKLINRYGENRINSWMPRPI